MELLVNSTESNPIFTYRHYLKYIYTYDSSKSSTNPLQKAISSKKTGKKRKKWQNVYNKCFYLFHTTCLVIYKMFLVFYNLP